MVFKIKISKTKKLLKVGNIFWLRISLENFVLIVLKIFAVYNQSLFQSLDSKKIREFICLKYLQRSLKKFYPFFGWYFVGFVSGPVSNFPPILYSGHFIVHCPSESNQVNLIW